MKKIICQTSDGRDLLSTMIGDRMAKDNLIQALTELSEDLKRNP